MKEAKTTAFRETHTSTPESKVSFAVAVGDKADTKKQMSIIAIKAPPLLYFCLDHQQQALTCTRLLKDQNQAQKVTCRVIHQQQVSTCTCIPKHQNQARKGVCIVIY